MGIRGLPQGTNRQVIATSRTGMSLVVQWLRLHAPVQKFWVASLIRELDPT